jgi:hypothetical protein
MVPPPPIYTVVGLLLSQKHSPPTQVFKHSFTTNGVPPQEGVGVEVGVEVGVLVKVGVLVDVCVGVFVGVGVLVTVGVLVGVCVGVCVGVGVNPLLKHIEHSEYQLSIIDTVAFDDIVLTPLKT